MFSLLFSRIYPITLANSLGQSRALPGLHCTGSQKQDEPKGVGFDTLR
jgi:hypothetical protein